MQRGGPRGTIPPPSQRHPAGPRWPLQVIVGVCVIVAVFFGMRLLRHEPAPSQPTSTRPPEAGEVTRPDALPETQPVRPVATGSALEAEFVSRLRLAGARRVLGNIDVAPDVLELVAELRLAEATDALETQARGGDRTAIVALAHLEHTCESDAPDFRGASDAALTDAARRAREMPKATRQRVEASITLVQGRRAAMS